MVSGSCLKNRKNGKSFPVVVPVIDSTKRELNLPRVPQEDSWFPMKNEFPSEYRIKIIYKIQLLLFPFLRKTDVRFTNISRNIKKNTPPADFN